MTGRVPSDETPTPPHPVLPISQVVALSWIVTRPCTEAEWRAGDAIATGHPSTWDRLRLSGPEGSITIMADDWAAIRDYIEPAPFGSTKRIYRLNQLGHEALRRATEPLGA